MMQVGMFGVALHADLARRFDFDRVTFHKMLDWDTFSPQEYAARAVQLALIAEVSRAYFQLQGVDARLEIADNTLDARLQGLAIAEKRFNGGLISKLEVKQAEVEVAATRVVPARLALARHGARPAAVGRDGIDENGGSVEGLDNSAPLSLDCSAGQKKK